MEEKFDYNDVIIQPAEYSRISSRKEINPFYNGFLPLITAPMDTVISSKNKSIFKENKINLCLPRGEYSEEGFNSYSLKELYNLALEKKISENGFYLIDVANGHMLDLLNKTKIIKELYPKITLMVGNIANPKTYVNLSNAGADLIRISIGNGGGCLTSQNTGIGSPTASLIKECYDESLKLNKPAKIIADGGMKDYSDIIKALALGADYVMLGSILNKAIESSGDNYLWKYIKVNQNIAKKFYKLGLPVYKKFRGMSTKEVQKKWGKDVITTSEGVVRYVKVEYTLNKWVENFESYLRSAMSYTNSLDLSEFIGQVKILRITNNSYKRFNK